MTAHLTEPVYYRMPRKILVYVLALCIFAMIENYLLMEQKPCPVSKPSAQVYEQSSAEGSDLTDGQPSSNGIGDGILEPSARSGRDYSNAGSSADSITCPAERTCS